MPKKLPWPGCCAIWRTMFFAACLVGCGSEREFYDVHGVITLDGEPVEYAEMHIRPKSDDVMQSGRTVHTRVVEGKFDTRPIGVAAGPAEWTIAAAAPGSVRVKNANDIGPAEEEQFLRAKKQVFVKEINIDRNEINIELP
jgi:hypothetical protein